MGRGVGELTYEFSFIRMVEMIPAVMSALCDLRCALWSLSSSRSTLADGLPAAGTRRPRHSMTGIASAETIFE